MISVVIPVLDGLHVLPTTAPAVLAMEGVDEIVWVDDGSTDGTATWLDRAVSAYPHARVVHQPTNTGRAAARNAGAQATSGGTLVFLDADVEPAFGTARALAEASGLRGAVAAVAHLDHIVGDPSEPYQDYVANYPRGPGAKTPAGAVLNWRFYLSGACAVRRPAFDEVGGFDPAIQYGEDVALGCDLRTLSQSGLRMAGTTVRLHDIGDLGTALGHAESFGVALRSLRDRCPNVAERAAVVGLVAEVAVPLLSKSVLALSPGSVRRRAVRYLLGATALRASHRA